MKKRKLIKKDFTEEIDAFEKALENLGQNLFKTFPMGVRRRDLYKATGGILYGRTEANKDSLGEGIPGAFQIGRHKIYPVDGIISTIRKRRVAA